MNKYDWSNVPKEVKWIATDEDSIVWGFDTKPNKVYSNGFSCGDDGKSFMLLGLNPFQGNWKDSLEERPND